MVVAFFGRIIRGEGKRDRERERERERSKREKVAKTRHCLAVASTIIEYLRSMP